jgi:hypothetical protein
MSLSAESEAISFLDQANDAFKRARDLTQQLLTFSKGRGAGKKGRCRRTSG